MPLVRQQHSSIRISSVPFSNYDCISIDPDHSTTPEGSPPPDLHRTLGLQQPTAPALAPAASSILEALANLSRQNASGPAVNASPQKDSSYNVSNAPSNPAQQAAAMNQTLSFPPIPPPVNLPAAAFPPQPQGSNNAQNFASNHTNPFAIPSIVPPANMDPKLQQQLMLIKVLSDQGVPTDQIPAILAAMMNSQAPPLIGGGGGGIPPPPPPLPFTQNQNQNSQNGWGARPEESRDRNGYHEPVRSPQDRYGGRRSRSRSPPRAWNARDSPASRRREEPNYDYDRDSPGRNRGDDRGRGRGRGNEYRQRSPPRRVRSPSPPPRVNGSGKKWIGHDDSIGQGKIKGIEKST
jgi:protein NRD1